jgi:3-keto-5-aminohexanoate cleavage enzyme
LDPLIIEAALNGGTPQSRNPNTPRTPDEIAVDALACLDAGATVIHTHIQGLKQTGDEASDAYIAGWKPVLEAKPDTIIYGTVAEGRDVETRFGHYRALADAGMRMGAFDPGSVNLATQGPDGLPAMSFVYQTSFKDIAGLAELLTQARLGPAIAIYEPGWLRATLAYEKAGRLPQGAFVKLYLAGDYNFLDGKKGDLTFGLPPTEKALDAYLEMMEGSALPWAASVIGGCVAKTGVAKLAIERGGHVRVGLEDYGGEDKPSNAALVAEVVEIATACGRPIATSAQAAEILKLPR